MCMEQNFRCVLYNHSRGKEGRVEEDYRQNFPRFLLSACISTFSCLPCQTGSLPVSIFLYLFLRLSFFLSFCAFPYFTLSFLNPGRPRCWSLPHRKCRSSVFSDSLHTNTEEEMEVITSFSAPHLHPSFLSPSTLNETLKGLPVLYLCP